jgi:hypothetical protein
MVNGCTYIYVPGVIVTGRGAYSCTQHLTLGGFLPESLRTFNGRVNHLLLTATRDDFEMCTRSAHSVLARTFIWYYHWVTYCVWPFCIQLI